MGVSWAVSLSEYQPHALGGGKATGPMENKQLEEKKNAQGRDVEHSFH